jgi:polyhydroxybutyrate depolymerase
MKKAVLLLLTSLILGSCKKNDTTLPTASSLRVEGTMTVDALSRTYLLNLPPNYNQSSDVPLVIALHGGGEVPPKWKPTII